MAPSAIRPDLLLRLPRELRDQIYYDVLKIDYPLPIKHPHFQNIPPILRQDSTLNCEALEAFYKVNVFTLDLECDPKRDLSDYWRVYLQAKQHIRSLIVRCDEHFSTITDPEEYEHAHGSSYNRRRWSQFLELPHLQSLTIRIQKMHDANLFTLDFAPILYQLRDQHRDMAIKFFISFDNILRASWNDPWWQQFNTQPIRVPVHGPLQNVSPDYEAMGYIDISDMMEPPSEEDREYVEVHLGDRKMPPARSIGSGLLSETPAQRRALGKHYVVREPALLRVLMEEHYQVYIRIEKEQELLDV